MQKIILIFVFLFFLPLVKSQNLSERCFLSTANNKDLFYIELLGNRGIVFRLGKWMDKGGSGYSIIYSDTIVKNSDSKDFIFSGNKSKIECIQNKLYLIDQESVHRNHNRFEIDTVANIDLFNSTLNNAYWWDNFFTLNKEINSTFMWQHYSFRNGFGLWESFDNKGVYYKNFETYADSLIKELRDSISTIHKAFTELTNELLSGIFTIEYVELKQKLLILPAEYKSQSWYFGTVINAICMNRPELFFALADDLPDKKEYIFSLVDSKESIKKLKKVNTDSSSEKAFSREKRKDKSFAIIGITAYTAFLVAFWGGIVYLLVK
jgi:hypothetical protein